MGKEIGIIMAAGLGARMYPLTEHTPKPLVRVHGIPMIETVIGGLQSRGISEIHVVVGHLQEQFEYLTEKYRGIGLIRNPEYQSKNNISSLYAAGGYWVLPTASSVRRICTSATTPFSRDLWNGPVISGNGWMGFRMTGYLKWIRITGSCTSGSAAATPSTWRGSRI